MELKERRSYYAQSALPFIARSTGSAELFCFTASGNGRVFVQLTGEVGAGKTTLCRALLEPTRQKLLDGANPEPRFERRPKWSSHCHGIWTDRKRDGTS